MASNPRIYSPADKEECAKDMRLLQREKVLAVDSQGVQLGKDGTLTLLQIGTLDGRVYLFDVMKNEREPDKTFFRDTGLHAILTSPEITKVIQCCGWDSAALFFMFGIKLETVFDTEVAHHVIQENKGIKIPNYESVAGICKLYSDNATVYEEKDDVQLEMIKQDGSYWAQRPLTKQMIDYASGNVTALIPEVYQNQKRILEENRLIEKFNERVQEEIEIEINPDYGKLRKKRHMETKKEILQSMGGKYRSGAKFSDVVNEDERKALLRTSLKDISNSRYSEVVRKLKLESFWEFLIALKKDMGTPEKFKPKPGNIYTLNEIIGQETPEMKDEGNRLKKTFCSIVIRDISRKYNIETQLV